MKRLMTLFLLSAVMMGCSNDDNPRPRSEVRATIDGVEYVFNTVNVELYPYEGYTDVEVTASINSDPSRTISFIVAQYAVGPNASWYFAYFMNQTAMPKVEGEFSTIVHENTATKLRGMFSGIVRSVGNPVEEIAVISNGTFDITYTNN
jgi:hypothetical protein